MSKRIKPNKPLPVQRWDDAKQGVAAPAFAEVPASRANEDASPNHLDRAITRKAKQLQEGTQISGAAQSPRANRGKIVSLGIEKFKTAGASRQRVGSVSNMPAFAKEAAKPGND